jgi:hypothetical protein
MKKLTEKQAHELNLFGTSLTDKRPGGRAIVQPHEQPNSLSIKIVSMILLCGQRRKNRYSVKTLQNVGLLQVCPKQDGENHPPEFEIAFFPKSKRERLHLEQVLRLVHAQSSGQAAGATLPRSESNHPRAKSDRLRKHHSAKQKPAAKGHS